MVKNNFDISCAVTFKRPLCVWSVNGVSLQTKLFLLFDPVLRVRFSVKLGRAVVLKIFNSCVVLDVAEPVRIDVSDIERGVNSPLNFFHEFGG